MKNKVLLFVTSLITIVIVGGVFAYQFSALPNQRLESSMESSESKTLLTENAATAKEDDFVKENEDEAMFQKLNNAATEKSVSYTGAVIAGSDTPYVRYNKADFDKARIDGKAIYLYFYATWCPLCAAERPKILNTFNSLSMQDAVGFEVHWSDGQNTEEDNNLARQYGISSQHTHVFIRKDGSVLSKKIGALSEGELESKLREATQV